MSWRKGEFFPKANEAEIQRTKFLLVKYKEMAMLMQDFEKFEDDLKQWPLMAKLLAASIRRIFMLIRLPTLRF
ncbi:hypothetical protein ACPV3A_27300 [Paenibacillus sp. Dod16]|uniref:hypothetical protein n=1 Tax=Paenibacillus sp. Dod16 TaxID=3416392 RepID=UPI003CF0E279